MRISQVVLKINKPNVRDYFQYLKCGDLYISTSWDQWKRPQNKIWPLCSFYWKLSSVGQIWPQNWDLFSVWNRGASSGPFDPGTLMCKSRGQNTPQVYISLRYSPQVAYRVVQKWMPIYLYARGASRRLCSTFIWHGPVSNATSGY